MIEEAGLKQIMPLSHHIPEYVDVLAWVAKEYEINTPVRAAMFLAQIAHESAQLNRVVERLDYTWQSLRAVFPRYFTSDTVARNYAIKGEQAIAIRVYANRLGNGPEEVGGDGWQYRGRGLIQITGKNNYLVVGTALGLNLVRRPQLLEMPVNAARSAGWWWRAHGLNQTADQATIDAFKRVTTVINGGLTGLVSRLNFWGVAKQVLRVPEDVELEAGHV